MSEFRQRAPRSIPSDLLSTKLALPRPHHSLLPREPLFSLLDSGRDYPVTLLSTPAGFGKTTLVRSWLAARDNNKPAWLSLDSGDNDPVRFWRYIIAACQHFDTNSDTGNTPIGCHALARLNSITPFHLGSPTRFSFERVLIDIINSLNELTESCILVIEDYHVIALSHIHETLAYFLAHLPASMHVFLLSRNDLPSPLAHLRAQGHIFELHSNDLRFSLQETRAFLQHILPFQLSEKAVSLIHQRTEGWGAGLNLLTLALRRYKERQQLEHFVETLTGSYRPLLEYLVSDVLDTQPTALQTFLLQTSNFSRLTAPLCDAVTGQHNSDLLLSQVEQANLFLEPLDGSGQWYRYHSLFAEAMQHEALHRLGTDLLKAGLQRASDWYERQGLLTEAIETSLKADDFARAAALIERVTGSFYDLETREFYTLQRWFEQLPLMALQNHPDLYLIYIGVLLFDPNGQRVTASERIGKIEVLLNAAEQQWHASENAARLGAVYTLRALLMTWRADFKKAGVLARQAMIYLECAEGGEEVAWRSACLSFIGAEEHFFGSLDVAQHLVQESLTLNRASGSNPYVDRPILLELAEIYLAQGKLYLAAENYRQVLAEAGEDLFDRSKALLGLAGLAYEWNRLETAYEQAQSAYDLGQRLSDEEIQVQAMLILARVQHAQGFIEQANQQLADLSLSVQHHSFLSQEVLYWQMHLHLISGVEENRMQQPPFAGDQIDQRPLHQLLRERILTARWLMLQNDGESARSLLVQSLNLASQHAHTASAIAIKILIAENYSQYGSYSEAHHMLQSILPHIRAQGYQRLLLDEGEVLLSLLHTLDNEPRMQASIRAATSVAATDGLSPQEQRVLRLFVAGLSKPEIAAQLVVSTNTVKTHLQHIYHKLHVSSRTEARETAHRLHLL